MDNYHSAKEMAVGLHKLAKNLWWTWNPPAQEIFKELSPQVWFDSNHNPVSVLWEISEQELIARLYQPEFGKKVWKVLNDFKDYIREENTWMNQNLPEFKDRAVAYFSAEFGLHECLPIYSGGLGLLAGDHAKSASDLGLPYVGISLFYRDGYFFQTINHDGWQMESYPTLDTRKAPMELITDPKGQPITCSMEVANSTIKIQGWRVQVGRVSVVLLDTNREDNEALYRDITRHTYGGDESTRLFQEMVLGIGGVKFLRAMGIYPAVYHMNEGHAAFQVFELLREKKAEGKSLKESEEWVRQHSIFTTHTPVPAGHDRFSRDLMNLGFSQCQKSLGFSIEELIAMGKINPSDPNELFCMTTLCLRFSRGSNGVSKLHGAVSREMWKKLYPGLSVDQVPIGHVTNGVHIPGWTVPKSYDVWIRKVGQNPIETLNTQEFWNKVIDPSFISDEELWSLKYALRRDLVEFARKRLSRQHLRMYGLGTQVYERILSPDILTIGFARRFATYKRAPLVFTEFEKTAELFASKERPVQMIFAGKAHPRDEAGKRFIQQVIQISRSPQFNGRVIFLEGYDINVARYLVSGVDVWLNTPRRPLEASGTSGMKVTINGGLNLSILDGWWCEGYDGNNGWPIGGESTPIDPKEQDRRDAEALHQTLSLKVIPEFYQRDAQGVPRLWLQRVRRAMKSLLPFFNTNRMVKQYVQEFYFARK